MSNVTTNPTVKGKTMHFMIMMTNDDGTYIEPHLHPTMDEAKARVQAGYDSAIEDDPDADHDVKLVWTEDTSFVDGRTFWSTAYPGYEPGGPGNIEYQIWAVTPDAEQAEMMAP